MDDEIKTQKLLFAMCDRAKISQSVAEAIIEPFAPTITDCILDAFDDFGTVPMELRSKLYPGTRGQAITNLIWENIRDGLSGQDGIEFCDGLHFFKVKIHDQLVVRFKRLNSELLAVSEDTDQAVTWFSNEPIRGVPNHLLRLNFGYRPSADWKQCSQFFLTHQANFSVLDWVSSVPVYRESREIDGQDSEKPAHGLIGPKIVPLHRPSILVAENRDMA